MGLTDAPPASSSAGWTGRENRYPVNGRVQTSQLHLGVRVGAATLGPRVLTMDCRGHRAAGRRERRVTGGHEGGPGREEVGTHILSPAPLLLQGLLQLLHLGPQLQQLLLVQPAGVRRRSVPAPALGLPSPAPSTCAGLPCARASSPQLRLQPVARAVGLLQVALQLLLPLPVGRLLLAQLLVLQLQPQERLPADRGVGSAGDGSARRPAGAPAGRLGRTGLAEGHSPGEEARESLGTRPRRGWAERRGTTMGGVLSWAWGRSQERAGLQKQVKTFIKARLRGKQDTKMGRTGSSSGKDRGHCT